MQSAVDYIIRFEYMQHMDPGEHTDRRVSSTYIDVVQERHPKCSPHRKVAHDYDYKTDNSNSGAHYLEPNWSFGDHYEGTIPGKERNSFLPDQDEPVNSMLYQDRMTHIRRKWRLPQVPWTFHDVEDLVAFCVLLVIPIRGVKWLLVMASLVTSMEIW
jgi:hypothetical protein